MLRIFDIVFLLFAGQLYSQTANQIGELQLSNAKVIKVDTVSANICGRICKSIRSTVTAKTEVQLSCNYLDASKNIYDTIKNAIYIYYVYDTTGQIHDSVISEIKEHVTKQGALVKQFKNGNTFSYLNSYLNFDKSFFVNGKTIIPFIWSGGESSGNYQIFYLNKQVYKIVLAESNGYGCLSSFVSQNMYFAKDGQRLDLGKHIKNTNVAKQIIARQ